MIFSEFSSLNMVFSMMTRLALQEDDIGYAKFLSEKVQAISQVLEMGKYNEYSPMLDIECAKKDVEETYNVVKQLIENIDTMYDFRKSGLYKHMKFRDFNESVFDKVKEKLIVSIGRNVSAFIILFN